MVTTTTTKKKKLTKKKRKIETPFDVLQGKKTVYLYLVETDKTQTFTENNMSLDI